MNNKSQKSGNKKGCLIAVVITIVIVTPIIAAVVIVALLSSLNASQIDGPKTAARNAITSVKAWQTGEGISNFEGMSIDELKEANPDLQWVSENQNIGENDVRKVSIYISNDEV